MEPEEGRKEKPTFDRKWAKVFFQVFLDRKPGIFEGEKSECKWAFVVFCVWKAHLIRLPFPFPVFGNDRL